MARENAETNVLIPLYGFLQGDTIGLLILAHADDRVADLADKLVSAASPRVAPRGEGLVLFKGRVLDPERSIVEAGLDALERFDVVFEEI